ncbi:PH domain-containing protein [Nafulsella turpanensis]|uniref:PH domain-containing protein n=1 Tax=Nafulsella turpanensis TaxID=1265690 RepID=UPI000344F494|nr:PH domain-containing protein [Nafulsella turpanensis]
MKLFESKEDKIKKVLTKAREETALLILPQETIQQMYLLTEDYLILTNKRVLLIDKSLGSNQRSIVTIPYTKIESVSLAKGNLAVFSPEVEISVGSSYFDFKLRTPDDAIDFYRHLSSYILS